MCHLAYSVLLPPYEHNKMTVVHFYFSFGMFFVVFYENSLQSTVSTPLGRSWSCIKRTERMAFHERGGLGWFLYDTQVEEQGVHPRASLRLVASHQKHMSAVPQVSIVGVLLWLDGSLERGRTIESSSFGVPTSLRPKGVHPKAQRVALRYGIGRYAFRCLYK